MYSVNQSPKESLVFNDKGCYMYMHLKMMNVTKRTCAQIKEIICFIMVY